MKNNGFIKIWDLPTRLFHWVLVALVIVSFTTGEIGGNAMTYHKLSGYAVLTLLLFRLIWGVTGSHSARFASFVRGPAAAWHYARHLMEKKQTPLLGHNPLGGWSVVAMLLALLLQAVTGLFANDEIATQGPLYPFVSDKTSSWLTSIHLFNQGVIIALVCLHLAAILFYLLVKKENLILPMITGRKAWKEPVAPPASAMKSSWIALIIAAICIVGVYLLTQA
ncbi:MAG: cytochrome b/b6 domain-containing protein [Desulfobacteraceae bacterium]|nr:cytochrome b/b6 domain-containing protein [Desulfobacteraceae bacterium]